MPQLIGLAFVGTALFYAYRFVKREMNRVGAELDRQAEAKPVPNLVKDPQTGIYRPETRA